MVLHFPQKKTFSNTLVNFISKEISALAKYSVNSGELWTAHPKNTPVSFADHKEMMAFTAPSLCQRSRKNVQHNHPLAVLPTLSSKL